MVGFKGFKFDLKFPEYQKHPDRYKGLENDREIYSKQSIKEIVNNLYHILEIDSKILHYCAEILSQKDVCFPFSLKTNTLLQLKTILSLLGEEIRGKVREEYEILNPTKTCDSA